MAKEVKVVVKAIRREEPDLRKLARALIQLLLEDSSDLVMTQVVNTETEAPK